MRIERQLISREFLDEVEPILKENKEEINHWGTELKIDKRTHIYGDVSGNYRGYVARDNEGKIVGYIGYWVFQDTHNTDVDQATQDLFYVDRDYRTAWIGIKLLKFSEEDLKEMGVKQILQQSPSFAPIAPILERMGYRETAVVYKKEV